MIYKLFWTGGFDSTFRLCQLVRTKEKVEPIYIINKSRKSYLYEIEAQKQIIAFLKEKGYGDFILPVRYEDFYDIPMKKGWEEDFLLANRHCDIVPQFGWLSVYANQHYKQDGYLEVCQEKLMNGQPSTIETYLAADNHGIVKKDEYGRYIIDKERTTHMRTMRLFGSLAFPVLEITNSEMLQLLQDWHLVEIIHLIRFCDGDMSEPCGVCTPCRNKIKTGLFSKFFSKNAMHRNKIITYLENLDYGDKISMRPGIMWAFEQYIKNDHFAFYKAVPNEMFAQQLASLFDKLLNYSDNKLEKYFKNNRKFKDVFGRI